MGIDFGGKIIILEWGMSFAMSRTRTSHQEVPLEDHIIELTRRRGQVHAWCGALGLHASGPTADSAIASLEAKLAEFRHFEEQSGIPTSSRLARAPADGKATSWLRRIAVPLVIGGLLAFQFGWAISFGIANGLWRAFNVEWRDGLIASLEQQLVRLADPKNDISAEQQKRLIAAIRALKVRYGPLWQEIVADPSVEKP